MLDKRVTSGGKKMPASKMSTPPRQVETSMSKKYKGTAKVSQTTIDNIKKMGMSASLKKAASSKNPEYLEGIKRMYGASRLAAAKKATASPAGRMSPRVAERTVNKSILKAKPMFLGTSSSAKKSTPVSKADPSKKNVGSKIADAFTFKSSK